MIDGNHPVWAVLAGLPPAERLVLLALTAEAGKDGIAGPAVARLARRTGYDVGSVRRAVEALVARGELKLMVKRPADRAALRPHRYAVRACLGPEGWAHVDELKLLELEELEADLDALKADLDAVTDDYGSGRITRLEFWRLEELFGDRISVLRECVAAARRSGDGAEVGDRGAELVEAVGGGEIEAGEEVAVGAEGGLDRRVPEAGLDDAGVHAGGDSERD